MELTPEEQQKLAEWVEENAYKFDEHEVAQSNGKMWVLTEAQMKNLKSGGKR